jgi:hypothetical protein
VLKQDTARAIVAIAVVRDKPTGNRRIKSRRLYVFFRIAEAGKLRTAAARLLLARLIETVRRDFPDITLEPVEGLVRAPKQAVARARELGKR